MHLIKDRTPKEWIVDFAVYNWFLVVPLLLLLVYLVIYTNNTEEKKMYQAYRLLKRTSNEEIISTTDGRVALATRIRLEKNKKSWKLPSKIKSELLNESMDIDKLIKQFSDGDANVE